MRWIFLILLSFNVVYFGWELDRESNKAIRIQSSVTHTQAGVEELQLVTDNKSSLQLRQFTDAQNSGDFNDEIVESVQGSINDLVTDLPEISITNLDIDTGNAYCFTYGPIAEELQAVGLSDWFKSRWAKTNMYHTDEHGKHMFWIYLSPEQSRNDAMETIQTLERQGVNDYRLINRGNLENAISLGLFSSQAAVNKRLQELEKKGYNPVIVPYYDGKRVYWLDVMLQVDENTLNTVIEGYPSRYNYVPVKCSKIDITMQTS